MELEEIFSQLSLWMSCFYVLNFTPFASNLSYICRCGSVFGIRNQRGPEYGSNLDPDPQHCLEDTIPVVECAVPVHGPSAAVSAVRSEAADGAPLPDRKPEVQHVPCRHLADAAKFPRRPLGALPSPLAYLTTEPKKCNLLKSEEFFSIQYINIIWFKEEGCKY